ncbi:MAG: hypothetical protein WBM44_23885 [Waterburya sp.]
MKEIIHLLINQKFSHNLSLFLRDSLRSLYLSEIIDLGELIYT